MKRFFELFGSTELLATLLLTASSYIAPSHAFSFQRVAPSNLDISQLGRVGVAGDFDAVSLYQFVGQNQNGGSSNGSSSLLSRYPNGAFATLQTSDGTIQTMCPFVLKDGTMAGVVVGGNFTSIGGVSASGVALFNMTTAQIVPLAGLSGSVNSLYCDQNSSTVYVGGSFSGGNSSNAIAWVTGWTNLPFAGFNGPVSSITKASNGNIIFGGNFDGLGNTTTPQLRDAQVIPLGGANISAVASSTDASFNNPKSIVCKTADTDGAGNTWLLADNTPGSWTANFGYGFIPTRLRLYNTNQGGRGTKTFRFTAEPINGIMNLSYVDPNGEERYCDARCPLPADNKTAQDFHFVNNVGMNSFNIDISEWYGAGGGLAGIELFQDDIYSYAINSFNEQQCDGVSNSSASATQTGPWTVTPSHASNSEYLTARLEGNQINANAASVVFVPNIKQAGNYSISIFTPGCVADNTCATRGRVNITGIMGSGTGTGPSQPIATEIWQTNDFDKYDEIYVGRVDAPGGSFRPSITITPSAGQEGPLTIVAQRVRANLKVSTGGLNGIFEYNPNKAVVESDFSTSPFDVAGTSLDSTATISALATQGDNVFIAGNFSSLDFDSVFSVSDKANDLGEGGLNGGVASMAVNNSVLYLGGSFTGTRQGDTKGLAGAASYNITTGKWAALGAGVNGRVNYVVPFSLNLTASNKPDLAIAFSGDFTKILAFDSNKEATVKGFAVWVPSRSNWLQNLNMPSMFIQGVLTAGTYAPGNPPLFAGRVSSFELGATGAFELSGTGNTIQQFPASISRTQTSTATTRKRAVVDANSNGVVVGAFYNQNSLNLTIYGGHFTATASNGSTINNLAIINGTDGDKVSGLAAGISTGSVIQALGVEGSTLFAGGNLTGNVNGKAVSGIIAYDLAAANYAANQPASLQGSTVTVNAISPQPSASNVFVGGQFDSAGSFNCPSLCVFDTSRSQWNSPGNGLEGPVTAMSWVTNTELVLVGNLSVNGNTSTVVTYDSKSQQFTPVGGPKGVLTAVTVGSSDGAQYWVAGTNEDSSPLLHKYNGSWSAAEPALGSGSVIQGLQIFTTTQNHATAGLLDRNNVLMVLGQLNISGFGSASAAIFNGTAWTPYALTASSSGSSNLNQVFVEKPLNFFKSGKKRLAIGFVVLIALAVALGLIFLLVVAGIIAERYRRRRDGYMPAPQTMPQDKFTNMSRVPPEHLFGSMNPASRPAGSL